MMLHPLILKLNARLKPCLKYSTPLDFRLTICLMYLKKVLKKSIPQNSYSPQFYGNLYFSCR